MNQLRGDKREAETSQIHLRFRSARRETDAMKESDGSLGDRTSGRAALRSYAPGSSGDREGCRDGPLLIHILEVSRAGPLGCDRLNTERALEGILEDRLVDAFQDRLRGLWPTSQQGLLRGANWGAPYGGNAYMHHVGGYRRGVRVLSHSRLIALLRRVGVAASRGYRCFRLKPEESIRRQDAF